MATQNVIVSGATGFIGRKLLATLVAAGHRVSAFRRERGPSDASAISWLAVGDLAKMPIDPRLGSGMDVFINLASPLRSTSTDFSGAASDSASIARNVCDFVAGAGIPRVVVMSSVAASLAGSDLRNGRRYGIEKLAADQIFLERLQSEHQVLILRPPAVYGPGMASSMRALASLVRRGLPIPLGSATHPRHYMSSRNLCDLVETIVRSDGAQWAKARGKIFEPSDGQGVSTRDLVMMIGKALGCRPRLVPVPLPLLRILGNVTGRSEMVGGAIDRLDMASVEDIDRQFGWRPIEQMPESLSFLGKEFSDA